VRVYGGAKQAQLQGGTEETGEDYHTHSGIGGHGLSVWSVVDDERAVEEGIAVQGTMGGE
jgi:hypothetical protein